MESLPETERENVAGAAELPTVTGESVTEPPAGTEVGGSCAVEAGAPDGPITSPEPPAAMERIAAATSTSPVLVITTESAIFWPFEAGDCEGVALRYRRRCVAALGNSGRVELEPTGSDRHSLHGAGKRKGATGADRRSRDGEARCEGRAPACGDLEVDVGEVDVRRSAQARGEGPLI